MKQPTSCEICNPRLTNSYSCPFVNQTVKKIFFPLKKSMPSSESLPNVYLIIFWLEIFSFSNLPNNKTWKPLANSRLYMSHTNMIRYHILIISQISLYHIFNYYSGFDISKVRQFMPKSGLVYVDQSSLGIGHAELIKVEQQLLDSAVLYMNG